MNDAYKQRKGDNKMKLSEFIELTVFNQCDMQVKTKCDTVNISAWVHTSLFLGF